MAELFSSEQLSNGVRINFNDQTNRYFGDYHRICIEVVLRFARDDYAQAHTFQTLERMGVSGGELEEMQHQVMTSFRQGTMKYMASDHFEEKFLQSSKTRKNILLPGLK